MFDYEKVIPAAMPMKRAPIKTRDPFNCMPATYTEGIQREAAATSKLFRAKVAADLERIKNETLQKT